MNLIKKILLGTAAVAAVALTPQQAEAQLRFGIKAGLNIDKIHLDNVESNFASNNRAGFTAGVMAEFEVPVIGICADASLMYTHMGSQVAMVTSTVATVEEPSKNFLQVPINVKYKFNIPVVAAYVKPYLFTGPDFAFKLGGDKDYIKTKTFQFAWNLGIGVELIHHLQIQGGYSFGCNNIIDKVSNVNLANDIKGKNSYWTISAAWLF